MSTVQELAAQVQGVAKAVNSRPGTRGPGRETLCADETLLNVNELALAAPQSFSASLLSANTLNADISLGYDIRVKLDHNLTMGAPSNVPMVGTLVSVSLAQDSTGGRTVTWHANYGGALGFMPRQGAGQVSCATFISNGDGTLTLFAIDGINTQGEIDIRDFGAKDANIFGGVDVTPIIEAAIAASVSMSQSGRTVVIPSGNWQTLTPLVIGAQFGGLRIRGEGKQNSWLTNGAFVGPQVIVAATPANGWTKPTIGAGPFTGSGAWPMDGTSSHWLSFSDCPYMCLNGLTENYISVWVKPAATTAGFIMSSRGGFKAGSDIFSTNIAFQIVCDGDDGFGGAKITGRLNTDGTLHTVACSTGIPLNSWTHVAMDYDGAHLRVFCGGVLFASAAVTGTVKQTEYENIVLGPDKTQQGGVVVADFVGSVSCIEFNRASQHTSNFTPPTAPVTMGADTQFFINFDAETSNYYSTGHIQLFGQGGAGEKHSFPYYIPLRRGDNGGNLMNEVEISDLFLSNTGGLFVFATAHVYVHDVLTSGNTGIVLENNSFISKVEDCSVESGGSPTATQTNSWAPRYGIYWGSACGYAQEDVTVTGFMFPFVTLSAGTRLSGLFLNTGADNRVNVTCVSYAGLEFGNNAGELNNVFIDAEAESPDFVTNAYVQGVQSLVVSAGQWDTSGPLAGANPFTVQACGVISFFGPMLGGSAGVDAVNSLDATTKLSFFGAYLAKGMTSYSNDAPNTVTTGCVP